MDGRNSNPSPPSNDQPSEENNDRSTKETTLAPEISQMTDAQPSIAESDGLSWPGCGILQRKKSTEEDKSEVLLKISGAIKTILKCVGEDPNREGLRDTPERYARALLFFTRGYEQSLHSVVNGAIFQEDHDEMVVVKDIEFFSLCEHHLVPFYGKVIGLSKVAKIVDMFSRRLQIQERLTKQIATALSEMLQPQGIAVVVEASHLCMAMRGVQKTGATTTTSCMLGHLPSDTKKREEILNLISRK